MPGPTTSHRRYAASSTGCTKTPEWVYGINRNGCTKTSGALIQTPPDLPRNAFQAAAAALTSATAEACYIAAMVMLVAAIVGFFVLRRTRIVGLRQN